MVTARTRLSPRSIVLGAAANAAAAGGCERMITDHWIHARLVARLARELADLANVDPEDASAAALSHDVGELLLLARHPQEYTALRPPARAHELQLELEQRRFGTDHALLGAEHLLDHRTPHVIADAVADHHEPFPDSEVTTLVVAAADEIADEDGHRRVALSRLDVSPAAATAILERVRQHCAPRPVAHRLRSVTQ